MKRRITLLIVSTGLAISSTFAQSSVDKVLAEIARNNKSIITNNQYQEAQKLTFKTGLTPNNPTVEYDYLPGSPAGAGTQKDFSITQGFDFPTSYGKKSKVSDQQIAKSKFEADAFRQGVLLEAKSYCIELIYRNKLAIELTNRFDHVNRVHQNYKTKLENGQGNILDVNKASLQLLAIKTELQINESERNQVLHKLTELNGGVEISLPDTIYPTVSILPSFDEIDSLIEANDPVVKMIKQDKEVAKYQVGVTKSLSLPKIEAGYHSQSILGQQYQGAHLGISIPLWENKNRVKAQNANLVWSDLQIQEHRTEHYYQNKQLYEQYLNFKKIVEEYQGLLVNTNNIELLSKALDKGEISTIEYFMEQSYFYSAYDKLLISDRELQKTVAELYKFQL
jgi:cobalt-zinc-cadmium efflux system outer membrane protein